LEGKSEREQENAMKRGQLGLLGLLGIGTCLLLAACATRLERPVAPFESKVLELAPGAPYEACVNLEAGDRLLFSYKADPPMAFAILRHVGDATISYILRELSRDERGIFFVPLTEDYCLRWVPPPDDVPWPTLLRYNIHLNAAG
jgi:hypothetical protein